MNPLVKKISSYYSQYLNFMFPWLKSTALDTVESINLIHRAELFATLFLFGFIAICVQATVTILITSELFPLVVVIFAACFGILTRKINNLNVSSFLMVSGVSTWVFFRIYLSGGLLSPFLLHTISMILMQNLILSGVFRWLSNSLSALTFFALTLLTVEGQMPAPNYSSQELLMAYGITITSNVFFIAIAILSIEHHNLRLNRRLNTLNRKLILQQQELRDLSYEAGQSEVAGHLIHFIGNLLNSTGVERKLLEECVERIPNQHQIFNALKSNKDKDLAHYFSLLKHNCNQHIQAMNDHDTDIQTVLMNFKILKASGTQHHESFTIENILNDLKRGIKKTRGECEINLSTDTSTKLDEIFFGNRQKISNMLIYFVSAVKFRSKQRHLDMIWSYQIDRNNLILKCQFRQGTVNDLNIFEKDSKTSFSVKEIDLHIFQNMLIDVGGRFKDDRERAVIEIQFPLERITSAQQDLTQKQSI